MAVRATIRTFHDLGESLIEAFGDYKRRSAEIVYEELTNKKLSVDGPGTPVATGTLRANWKAAPGKTGTASFKKNTGEIHSRPPRFDTFKYTRNWSVFTIYNTSPYVLVVNDGMSGNDHNQNFIQASLKKAEGRINKLSGAGSANA